MLSYYSYLISTDVFMYSIGFCVVSCQKLFNSSVYHRIRRLATKAQPRSTLFISACFLFKVAFILIDFRYIVELIIGTCLPNYKERSSALRRRFTCVSRGQTSSKDLCTKCLRSFYSLQKGNHINHLPDPALERISQT